MMAANCHDRYYRVLVTGFVTEGVVTGLYIYIDIESSAEIAIWDLLCRQSISARLEGIREGRRGPRDNSKEEASTDDYGRYILIEVLLDSCPAKRMYRMENTRPAIILQHIHSGFSLAVARRVDSQHATWMVW